jgi:chorismate lyase/3-hydroxybenzoate synthase
VGTAGSALEIHVLLAAAEGETVENPLQFPAYRYSQRYGKRPPCFSRAMRVEFPSPCLLVSGTAAIRGEDTRYAGSPLRQFLLTLENLRALLESVRPVHPTGGIGIFFGRPLP